MGSLPALLSAQSYFSRGNPNLPPPGCLSTIKCCCLFKMEFEIEHEETLTGYDNDGPANAYVCAILFGPSANLSSSSKLYRIKGWAGFTEEQKEACRVYVVPSSYTPFVQLSILDGC